MASSAQLTYFAPPERASKAELTQAVHVIDRLYSVRDLLEAVPGPAIILNLQRQIIAANQRFLRIMQVRHVEEVLGMRPGEALHCRWAESAPSGCGTGQACQYCDFVKTLLVALSEHELVTGECRLLTRTGAALDLEMAVTHNVFDEMIFLFVGMRDVGAEKRREVLERTFFHDVLNTAGGIQGLLTLMTMDNNREVKDESFQRLQKLSSLLIEEIQSQRQLLAAENNVLMVEPQPFRLDGWLCNLVDIYEKQPLANNKQIIITSMPTTTMRTDQTLLSRVIGNLLKNALEATEPGGRVDLGAKVNNREATIFVHNDAVLDESTSLQLFQRSFSSKGSGRGVGLYSAQLFTERFLGGKISFRSSADDGTVFEVRIPIVLQA